MKMRVSTPSRLHFGIIDMRGDIGRLHGSAGVAIETPRLVFEVEDAGETVITGARSGRAQVIIDKVLRDHGVNGGVHLDVQSDIPEHMGFGSGTQLSIALGTALNSLFDLGMSYEEIVVGLGRGRRSGIGTHSFLHGGFISFTGARCLMIGFSLYAPQKSTRGSVERRSQTHSRTWNRHRWI